MPRPWPTITGHPWHLYLGGTLVAFYVKGQSLLEMSDEFNAPLGTIKRRLHVARKRLAKEVEPMAV